VYLTGFRNGQDWENDPTAKAWLRDAVRRRTKRISPYGLLRRYRSQAKGLVIWDPALAVDTQNVATTMAGVKRLLPVSPALAARLRKRPYRLRVGADLRREQFESREQAYDWALEKFGPPSKFSLLAWLGGPRNGNPGQHGLRDLIVARRGFAFEGEPHREGDFVTRLLDRFPRGTPVYGYPFFDDDFYSGSCQAGYCYATGEPFGVGEISRSGKFLIPSASSTNLTVHSRFRPRAEHPRWDERPRTADPGKTYVTFILSDGDSLGYNQHGLRTRHWDDRARGSIPMGISISPWLAVLEPRIYRYYVRTIKPSDVLIAGPSGAGYIYPQLHPDLGGYLAQSRRIMGLAGLRPVWILDNGYAASPSPEIVQQYVDALHPPAIFADYGGWAQPNPPAVSFTDGVPVVHALWGPDVGSTVQKVRLAALTYPGRPAFVFVGLITWSMGYSQAREVMKELGPSFTVVRPDRFVGLLKGTYGGGATGP
jgi:putative glycoside hydrolase with GxGYxYP motif/GxGYxY motif-containing protein